MSNHADKGLTRDLKRIHALYENGGLSIPEYQSCKTAAIKYVELQYKVLPLGKIEKPLEELKQLNKEEVLTDKEWAEARHYFLIHARISKDAIGTLSILRDFGSRDLISLYDYDETKRHLLGETVWTPTIKFSSGINPGVTEMKLVDYISEILDIPEILAIPASAYWIRNIATVDTRFDYIEYTLGVWTSLNNGSYTNLAFVQEQLGYYPGEFTDAVAGQAPRAGTISIERILEILRAYSEREFNLVKAEVLDKKDTPGEGGRALSILYPLLTY